MSLQLYRRHTSKCSLKLSRHTRTRRHDKPQCRCPISAEGTLRLDGFIRKGTGETSWEKAENRRREWEDAGTVREAGGEEREPGLAEAVACYLADLAAQKLAASSIAKHRVLLQRNRNCEESALLAFAAHQDVRVARRIDVQFVTEFRATWRDGPMAGQKKLERLRAFFRWIEARGWHDCNPAAALKSPRVRITPKAPFEPAEVERMLDKCDEYADNYGNQGGVNARRLRAMLLLLRYSGLRIGDAIQVRREYLRGDRLRLPETQKTGVAVVIPLPSFVVQELRSVPATHKGRTVGGGGDCIFWTGTGAVKSAVGNWQRAFKKLFLMAGVEKGHPHRFRHTFAVELLKSAVPIEDVSRLLGHNSVRTTERHYAAWVKARQDRLEANVAKSLAEDPIVLKAQSRIRVPSPATAFRLLTRER